MPLTQGGALWNLQKVFTNPRSSKTPQRQDTEDTPVSLNQGTSFWKPSHVPRLFSRKRSNVPCTSPRRSASAPQEIILKGCSEPCTSSNPDPATKSKTSAPKNILNKSCSAPYTFPVSANSYLTPPTSPSTSLSKPHTSHGVNAQTSDTSQAPKTTPKARPSLTPCMKINNASPPSSPLKCIYVPNTFSFRPPALKNSSAQKVPVSHASLPSSPLHVSLKSAPPLSPSWKPSPESSQKSSPAHSPLKSPSTPASPRKASAQEQKLPVSSRPPWSELVEARKRLMAVEGHRRALCALEMHVQQIHYVFLQAELRVAKQREGLVRLVEAAGRAEVQTAVHGQRIRRTMRRHKPRLLACALCVPWSYRVETRVVQHPRRTRCAIFQGRGQVLRGCVGCEESGTRD
ncbi:hypothetical protein XELAEV_18015074mg [Xenopus laevis]|uniref:Uncharacterized protein n=1 Tax=Xenopus laevis TaxID=8355 RepID=A0A974DHU3_XENLA|nr:hypothetical protein XELAEV_18015074mg [Xenopus laevis]